MNVDLMLKPERLTSREWVAWIQTPPPLSNEGKGVCTQATGGWVEYTKNASVAGCQIFPIPPLPGGNHLRGKCVTRVLMPRAPCQMISMMSTDFFKYVISFQST